MAAPLIELQVSSNGSEQRLVTSLDQAVTIGRDARCQVVIDDPAIAPHQAQLVRGANGSMLLQAAGPNALDVIGGLLVNGEPVSFPVPLREGETLTIAGTTLTWRTLTADESPTIAAPEDAECRAATELVKQLRTARYRSDSEIGRGGMGKVFAATDNALQRTVALKLLRDPRNIGGQARFIREARITGALQHPSIVPVHELNVDSHGNAFYTMKLVKGMTLLQILHDLASDEPRAQKNYRLPVLLTIFQKVCDAVAFAHSQTPPVIHRDLKPENMMVGDYGEVLVMDWGAAKVLGSADDDGSLELAAPNGTRQETRGRSEHDLTQPGSIMGTPGYMAPEQASGHAASADQRTDVYALGAILYAILTLDAPLRVTGGEVLEFEGGRLLRGKKGESEWRNHVAPLLADRSARPRLRHLPHETIPESLAAVALKAMAFGSEERFASVKELQADVAAYQSGFATTAENASPWTHLRLLIKRNKTLFGALAAVFAVLVSATAISLHQRKTAIANAQALEQTLHGASLADLEAARQRFRAGAWREGVALLARSLSFWPANRAAANYLLSAIAFGRGDRDKLPIFGVYHPGPVGQAAFSPDGRYFATAGLDGTTRVWDAATGAAIGPPLHHEGACNLPSFAPDGRKIFTTSEDGVAKLWEIGSGELLLALQHGRPDLDSRKDVERLVLSPDRKQLLTSSFDHTARLWDAATGKETVRLVNPQRIADAIFSPDGTRILTSYWYGGAILWDATTFRPIGAPMKHDATVRRSLFTPDGNKIITGSLDKTARVWDGHTAKPVTSPLNHPDRVWSIDVSPDGKLFATACYDKMVRLWSLPDGAPVGVPMKHDGPVDSVMFSPDGKRVVSASRDHTARLWDVATCRPVGNPMRHDETVLGAIFNPADGTKVLSFGWDNAAYLWEAEPRPSPGEVIPIPGRISSISFAGDEDHLFVATRDGKAGIWSLPANRFVSPAIQQADPISAAAFDQVTNRCATADPQGVIRFWDLKTGHKLGETKPGNDTVQSLAFASGGQSVFAAYLGGTVLQWKIPEGAQIGPPMKHSEKMDALAVAPSGREIATGCRDDYLYVWWPGKTTVPRKIRHTNPVLAASYSPDGQFIATGCDDHTARIWSLASGKEVGAPFYIDSRVTALHYTDGGKKLLIGGINETQVHCYDLRTHDEIYLPLPHSSGVAQITSNSDGSLVVTVTDDGTARLWRIPSASVPPPKWLAGYLRASGGLAFSSQQQLVEVPIRERLELRKKLLEMPSGRSAWDSVMRSSFETSAGEPAKQLVPAAK